jgi:hypothetical protein
MAQPDIQAELPSLPSRLLAAYTAFAGNERIADGQLQDIAIAAKAVVTATPEAQILVFDNRTGKPVDMNLHGSLDEVLVRLPRPAAAARDGDTEAGSSEDQVSRSAGRPRLGVVGREVTLLPRHWEWLNGQPGGASVALRKLVEKAQKESRVADEQRAARETGYHFINAMAGDQPGFEEASRALFAGNRERFRAHLADWPQDVRDHALALSEASFADAPEAPQADKA